MAWEDRTSFDVIQAQVSLTPGQIIKLMRSEMKPASFKMWRIRTAGRTTKHVAKRGYELDRFRCPTQKDLSRRPIRNFNEGRMKHQTADPLCIGDMDSCWAIFSSAA